MPICSFPAMAAGSTRPYCILDMIITMVFAQVCRTIEPGSVAALDPLRYLISGREAVALEGFARVWRARLGSCQDGDGAVPARYLRSWPGACYAAIWTSWEAW
jgi:hypothetical protein